MHVDARTLPDGSTLDAEVVVVGAGPAGITVALELARRGTRVLLLESGGRERDRRVQALARATSAGTSYFPVHRARVRAFAGTSQHWADNGWFRARPLDPIDLEVRPAIPHTGWPIAYEDLEPYYARAHRWCELGPYDYGLDRWTDDERTALDLDPDVVRTVVFLLTPYDTWTRRWAEVVGQDDLQLVTHCTVRRIATDERPDRVDALECATLERTTITVRGDRVVLAAGGLENPRLLLLSDGTHRRGIGNDHDQVGRCFMEHLAVRAGNVVPDDPAALEGLPLYRQQRDASGRLATHAKLAVAPDVLRREGLLNATFFLFRFSEARASQATRSFVTLRRSLTWRPAAPDLAAHARVALRGARSLATVAVEEAAARRGRRKPLAVWQMMAMAEQAPDPGSRVLLDRREDALGLRRARLDWRLSDIDRRSIERSQELVAEQLEAAGIGRVEGRLGTERPAAQIQPQWHHMGTTRMAADPSEGVVDADGRVHGIDNLYVAGSSTFPTGGYANPTLTIVALAVRLADHLAGQPAAAPGPQAPRAP